MFNLNGESLSALWLTLQVASVTTLLLVLIGLPLAWWLARSEHWTVRPVAAAMTLPLVLPPSVLGFYLLVAMGPQGPIGQLTSWIGIGILPFTFGGLVVGSVIYSMPFMVQPLLSSMEALGDRPLEVAATLRAGPFDTFWHVVLPLCRPGLVTGVVMSFAHTVGEFGVVLMIGGNIPGITRVVSVQIYDHVEALEYGAAHQLAALMLAFSFAVLLGLQWYNRQPVRRSGQ